MRTRGTASKRLAFASLFLFTSTFAAGQDTTGTGAVIGSVREPDAVPVPGVRLCAIATPRCATSDGDGRFRIDDLRAGTYRIEILFPLTSAGRGHAAGVEVFLERRLADKFYGQGNVAFSRTRHAGLDGVMRPGSFDYPVVFNLVGGYRASPKWEFSTRFTWLSGRPYTPYDIDESTAQRRAIYDLGRVNDERLPDYVRFDVRVDRTFTVSDQPFVLFFGIQNVLDRENVGSYQWNRRTNAEELGAQQGLFPILGLTYRF